MRWYAAQTHPSEEITAARKLTEQAIEVWLPSITERVIVRHQRRQVTHYLGYLFIQAPAPPLAARYTEGILRLLPFSDAPAPIPDDQMLAIRETIRAANEAMSHREPTRHIGPEPTIAGMARSMVANLLRDRLGRVTLRRDAVEPAIALPRHGRRNHGHDLRRAERAGVR